MAGIPLPEAQAVGELLGQLVDKEVVVEKCPKVDARAASPTSVYVGDDDAVRALCVCELELAAHLGAALGMMPVGAAKDAVAAGALPEGLQLNFREVMNICAAMLCANGSPHVRLLDAFPSQEAAGAAAQKVAKSPAKRVDYQVAIDGFGGGKLAFLLG
ncbi:MAG: hypothetical protein R3E88_03695 [Myxococcota bacterium]|nr:hypothetical protein [Myxococcales bacterium]